MSGRKTRNPEAPGCQFVRRSAAREGSDPNWGPSNLDIFFERPPKKLKQGKTQQNRKRKAKQNKWTSRKAVSRTWAGGCANRWPFPDFSFAHRSVDAGTETQIELKLILAHTACEAK